MKKFWSWLSGKKTVVGAVILAVINLLQVFGLPEYVVYVEYVGNVLVTVGVLHKGWKIKNDTVSV